jgi:hypothetical protein
MGYLKPRPKSPVQSLPNPVERINNGEKVIGVDFRR